MDLLIAGTSCVDYSTLNNEKQDIDSNGESGRTFRGMMSWVDKHRPPLVVLENVCGAPWDRVVRYFEKIGYSASFQRIDTKFYYIPHTRTRVYLLAVRKDSGNSLHTGRFCSISMPWFDQIWLHETCRPTDCIKGVLVLVTRCPC